LSVTRSRNYSLFLITFNPFNAINIKLEGAAVKSMSNVRGRKVLNGETPHVLEGSGLTTVDGMEGE